MDSPVRIALPMSGFGWGLFCLNYVNRRTKMANTYLDELPHMTIIKQAFD